MAPRWHCDGTEKKICRLFAVFWDLAAVSLRDLKDLKDPRLLLRGPSRLSRPACLGGVPPPNSPDLAFGSRRAPAGACGFAAIGKAPPRRVKSCFLRSFNSSRLTRPSLRYGTSPLPRFAQRGASRASAVRYRSPTPAQVSAFYAGMGKGGRKRDAEGRLSEASDERSRSRSRKGSRPTPSQAVSRFGLSQAPWGAENGGIAQ